MGQIEEKEVGGLAVENQAVLKLFLQYEIDFYCKGKRLLKEVLLDSKIDKVSFLSKLNAIQKEPKSNFEVKIEEWPLDLLADYIQKTHHRYTDQTLVDLKALVNEYIDKDLEKSEAVKEFKILLELLAKELGGHMKKEELILFPYIRKMIATKGKMDEPRFKTVENPIEMMMHEHDTAFELLRKIRMVLNNYNLDEQNPEELNIILNLISDLDEDLAVHIHLENNILFPNVMELEKIKLILTL